MQFTTDTGIHVPAVTREQIRALDRVAVEETGPNLFQMMENAGRTLAIAAMRSLGTGWRDAKIVVLAGAGGNGGGGICAARHLANRSVRGAVALCLSSPERLGVVPAYQRKIFTATRGREVRCAELAALQPDLILDALVGYGLEGRPTGLIVEMIEWANASGAPIIALDVPSGVDSTTGETPGVHVNVSATLTLALPKTGLRQETAGALWLGDLGIPEAAFQRAGLPVVSPFDHRFLVPLEVLPMERRE